MHQHNPQNRVDELRFIIRRQRQLRNLSQHQVAERLGVTAEFITLVEAGRRRLHLDRVAAMADALGLDPRPLCRLALQERAPSLHRVLFPQSPAADWYI